MTKKGLAVIIAAGAVFCMAGAASAATFTAANGVLSIELPNESWTEITDPTRWIALSDGGNLITVDHYSNGEKLPEIQVADAHYVNVYETAFSTQNEVFLITGCVVDAAKIPEVRTAVMSAQILQYDTKLAVQADTAGDITIAPMSGTMYAASSGINVRSGYSTNDQIIGTLSSGTAVTVTGKVQKGGADLGWYQISYNSGTGYVAAQFLASAQPAAVTPTPAPTATPSAERKYTGVTKTIYDSDGDAVTVSEATDGNWYDANGKLYYWVTDYQFTSSDGSQYSTNKPQTGSANEPLGGEIYVFWGNSNQESLTLYSDGYYYSSSGVRYSSNGDGTYSGADGTTLYNYDPVSAAQADNAESDSDDTYNLVSEGSGRPATIVAGGGAFYDENGVTYYNQGDGSFVDEYGDTYWIQ